MQEIEIKKTEWDLTPLLKEEGEDFLEENRKEIENAANDFIKKWKNRADYLESSDSLKEALDEYERWDRFFGTDGKVGFYYHLLKMKNQTDSEVIAKYNKIEEFSKKILNDMQFFVLSLGKIKVQTQKKFLEDSTLRSYRHFLERVFIKSKYMLSDEQEKIINLFRENAYVRWGDLVSSIISSSEKEIDAGGKKEKKVYEEILKMISDKNKSIRDDAARKVNEILSENAKIAEVELNSILSYKKTMDELRGYDRADKSRHVGDDIDSEIVDVLIERVANRFDIAKHYYELKSKLLGLEKLEYHERNVEYGEIDEKYSFDDSINIVYNAFNKLDKKFSEILKNFIENGQVDIYPKKGKKGGACCCHSLISNPTYILLNHTDKFDDVITLAHEFGHAINDEFIKLKQNSLNFGTNIATAEVASTFMEDFVVKELEKNIDDEKKLIMLMIRLNNGISTIFRQAACYLFEKELHFEFRNKGYLSKEEIGKIFQKNMGAYMGEFVLQSPGSENWWVYWSHIRGFFYVYSYPSGLLISKSMQKKVKNNPKFIEKVKEFLSAGLSDSPKNVFLNLGIDISKKEFWDEGLNEIEDMLNEAKDLAKKLGKI